jgi:transposase
VVSMDRWETIRLRCLRDGEPIKVVARELGMSPNTVRKYVRSQRPPTKVTLRRERRLDRYRSAIHELLRSTPRITAKRIGTVLIDRYDPDLPISERALREYVAECRLLLVPKEAFVRAHYAPGQEAQFDFSPMRAILAGAAVDLQIFVMRLSYSGHFYARASYREDRPALFAGLLGAVTFFAGLPRTALFDNAKTAVRRILKGRAREENPAFRAFCGALALQVEYAAPRAGNQKGGVEGCVGYVEDNFFRPTPSFASLNDLNRALERFCLGQLGRLHAEHRETIGARFERERAALRPLPAFLPEPCVREYVRVNKFAEVTIETNRYSVPTCYVARDALADVYDERVVIRVDGEVAAEHRRPTGKHQSVINPLHYVELISRKHRSASHALAFADERLRRPLVVLRERLVQRDESTATKTCIAILRLALETSLSEVVAATEVALARGTLDPHAITLLLRQRAVAAAPAADGTLCRLTPAGRAQVVDLAAYRIAALTEKPS